MCLNTTMTKRLNVATAVCMDCKQEKPIEQFHSRGGKKAYLRKSECKACSSKRTLLWQKKNRERYLAYNKEYHRKKHDN